MTTTDIPPDLRVLCRILTSTPPGDLPALCPALVNHALRCGGPLSAPHDQKFKGQANEAAGLVQKLKIQINTLLHGKTHQGRFAGIVLVKAVIDVGGWECLRASEKWIGGLILILQKPDPAASKALCIVTLTRIYTLLSKYPTLVREIATPTIQSFTNACLQLTKPRSSGKTAMPGTAWLENINSTMSVLVPLYPTTLRPLSAQLRAAVRPYLAPTWSDGVLVPQPARRSARRLAVLLHYTAPKNGNAEEWTKAIATFIREIHATADQIFRGVQESWESTSGLYQTTISYEGDPRGGGDAPEQLPSWTGISGGSQRLVGLLDLVAEFFRCPTKCPVTIPINDVADLMSRLALVLPPLSDSQDREVGMQINPSIGREEREELWSVLVDIHLAAMNLWLAVVRRLGSNSTPLGPQALDHAVRIFKPNQKLPRMRGTCFILVRELLRLVGPSLPRLTVDSLDPVIHACCEDLLGAAGHLAIETGAQSLNQNGTLRAKSSHGDADAFLASQKPSSVSSIAQLEPTHQVAAEDLLEALLSYAPQQHVKKAERALMDRTAIQITSKRAMVASVLHPYIDKSGRYFANTIPFLVQAYPHDADVEVLRSNLRSQPLHHTDLFAPGTGEVDVDLHDMERRAPSVAESARPEIDSPRFGEIPDASSAVQSALPEDSDRNNPTGMPSTWTTGSSVGATPAFEPLTLKRKNEDEDQVMSSSKRLDKGKPPEAPLLPEVGFPGGNASGDSDSDESVQLQGVLEEDEDDESMDN